MVLRLAPSNAQQACPAEEMREETGLPGPRASPLLEYVTVMASVPPECEKKHGAPQAPLPPLTCVLNKLYNMVMMKTSLETALLRGF